MTAKEAARQRWEELKDKPLKQKLGYIVTYYWFPIIAVLAIVIFAVSYIVHVATLKDVALNVTCVNATAEEDVAESFAKEFAQEAGIDLKEYEVELSTNMMLLDEGIMSSYDSAEVLITMIGAQSIDVLVSDQASMLQRFYQDVLADLSQVLSDEQTEAYRDAFLYLDKKVLEEVSDITNLEKIPSFPDPTKPDEMEEPIPVAIRIPADTEFAKSFFPDCEDDVVIGLAINAKNITHALAFLDFVME